jgi:hypothetical protein
MWSEALPMMGELQEDVSALERGYHTITKRIESNPILFSSVKEHFKASRV